MAALLTSEMHSTDGVVKYISECRDHDISVLPPDINESEKIFTVSGTKVHFGLVAVKNVGESAIDAIVAERENGKYTSLIDFSERVDLHKVNRRVVESLIVCGAFDSTGARRSQMMAALDEVIEYGQQYQRELADPQMGLFHTGGDTPSLNAPSLPDIEEWEGRKLLALEKESLGFYITGHPLDRYETVLEKFTNANGLSIREMNDGQDVRIGGMVSATKVIRTRKGDLMAFITTEDLQGAVETTIFSRTYAKVEKLIQEDQPILIQGRIQKDEQAVKIIADEIISMDKAEEYWSASVHIHMDVERVDRDILNRLNETIARHHGSCKGFLHLLQPEGTEVIIALPDNMMLQAGSLLRREVNALLGDSAVETTCTPVISNNKNGNGFGRNNSNGRFYRS
jgi:DNA polymerase-3 subunit alpha